jgi:hypothetical protein
MSVNLSSERVRRALWYFEGVRNGQLLSALLGYQFERGLHEHHPNSNLDKFILPLRKKFPLIADHITESSIDAHIDALEASNVVDGLALVTATKDRDNLSSILDFPDTPASDQEKTAITSEIERIMDDFDAMSDLILSESVFQVAQGNYDRAGAILKFFSEAKLPPEIQIVNTPRSSVVFTHRVMIDFNDTAPSENPWPEVESSPRSQIEPRLNHWLGRILGQPTNIRCSVEYQDPEEQDPEEKEKTDDVSLQDLNLQPIDFIYQTGQDLRDEATELENRISYHIRKKYLLTQDVPLNIRFMERKPDWEHNVKTFFEILPLVNNLREIIIGCRPLGADDFILPSDEVTNSQNRRGFDLGDLKNRAGQARQALENSKNDLGISASNLRDSTDEDLFEVLRTVLLKTATLGIPDAIPVSAVELTESVKDQLIARADSVLEVLQNRLIEVEKTLAVLEGTTGTGNGDRPDPPSPDVQIEQCVQVFKAVFGRSFNVMPLFTLQNPEEVELAVNNSDTLLTNGPPLFVNEWLQGLSRVRPKILTYHTALLLADAFEHTLIQPIPAQLPFKKEDTWIALPTEIDPQTIGDKLSLVMQLPESFKAAGLHSGLLIDSFVEGIPNENTTTGLAFHFDQPISEAPQTLLLAVTPEVTGSWKWQDLQDAMIETLDMAKKRAVEPDNISDTECGQLLPAIMTAVTNHFTTISVDLDKKARLR